MSLDMSIVLFILNGVVGALIHALWWAKKPEDMTSWEAIKSILIGGLAGYIYWWGYISHGLPDGLMAIIVGYCARDFMDWVVERFAPWVKKQE